MFTDAIFAGLRARLSAFAGPVLSLPLKAKSAPISGPVKPAKARRKPGGRGQPPTPSVNLKARALTLHNRNAKAASAYERVHTILGSRQ